MEPHAESARQRGNELLKAGKLEEAVAAYDEGVTAAGDNAAEAPVALLSNRSLALLKLGRFEEALADAQAVLEVEPSHGKAGFRKGKSLLALRRWDEAAKTFGRLAREEPKNPEIRAELANAKTAAAAERGELDFAAMLKEALTPGVSQLKSSRPLVGYYNSGVLEVAERRVGGGSRHRSSCAIDEGALLFAAAPPAAFASAPVAGRRDVDEVCQHNGFASASGVGLWQRLSFFEHSGEPNCIRFSIADWTFVRTSRRVEADEDLSLSYTDPCADYASEAARLKRLGVSDEGLSDRARRWEETADPALAGVRSCLDAASRTQGAEDGDSKAWPAAPPEETHPFAERCWYLALFAVEAGVQNWAWGPCARWLRLEERSACAVSLPRRALGAALARADVIERHAGSGVLAAEAWSVCMDHFHALPPWMRDGEEGDTIFEICMEGLERCAECLFGAGSAGKSSFLELVHGWASAACTQQAAEA